MGYQKPLVQVFQEYADLGVTPPDTELSPCIVGPAFHIIDLDDSDDKELGYVGNWSEVSLSSIEPPENKPGAEVKEESIRIILEEVKTSIAQDQSFDSLSDTTMTFTSFPSGVQAGDKAKVKDGSGNVVFEEAEVKSVDEGNSTLDLNRSVETEITSTDGGTVDIYRLVDDVDVMLADEANMDFDSDYIDLSSYMVDSNEILEASIYVGYRSFRTDLARVNTVYGATEAEGKLGKLNDKDNPLGMGVNIALANTVGQVKFIGIDDDSEQGFYNALDRLEGYDDVYAITPLSTNIGVISAYVSHCEQMSLPETGQWRVTLFGSELVEEKELATGTGQVQEDSDTNPRLFRDPDASFESDGVIAGDFLKLKDGSGESSSYVIASVLTEDQLLLDEDVETTTYALNTDFDYEVYKELDRTGQAEYIKEISEGFQSKRAVHVWPSKCIIQDQEVPGYYLACAIAGATGGLPSHRGFTRLSIGGVTEIQNANDLFNKTQLNIIASGGTFIFTQENPDAPIIVRHQLTTDMSAVEFQEYSFVKNYDYVSILSKQTMDRYIGTYNITKATFGVLENGMRALLESLRLYKLPKIGSPVLKYSVGKIYQHEENRTRVEMYVDVWFPYALNYVGLHLVSQGTTDELTK